MSFDDDDDDDWQEIWEINTPSTPNPKTTSSIPQETRDDITQHIFSRMRLYASSNSQSHHK
eukprot:4741895-Ditylum_brightwellii.AAC.1